MKPHRKKMAQDHSEYRRNITGSNRAILFVHGILGTPRHFDTFLPLVSQECSVYNLLLDGHGKGVRDFGRTSMQKWKAQVDSAVKELLQNHRELIIVAHSMGTLFAIEQAIKRPETVKALFLLAVPLKIKPRPAMLKNLLKIYFGRWDAGDVKTEAAFHAYGIRRDLCFWRYIPWIPRYLELFAEIRRVRAELDALHTPAVAFQSRGDELVSAAATKALQKNPNIRTAVLPDSAHYYYAEQDRKTVLQAFERLLAELDEKE